MFTTREREELREFILNNIVLDESRLAMMRKFNPKKLKSVTAALKPMQPGAAATKVKPVLKAGKVTGYA